METRVKITNEESRNVEILFLKFRSYCNILGVISNYDSIDNDRFDRKWAEAVELEMELSKLKSALDKKYRPQDGVQYNEYKFDFENKEMVYT